MIDIKVLCAALNATSEGVLIFCVGDNGWDCVYANQASEGLYGFSKAELLGPINDNSRIFSILQDKSLRTAIRRSLNQGRSCRHTLELTRVDGSVFCCEMYLSPLFDDKGRWTHTVMISHDISEKIRHAREIESHNRLLEERNQALQNIAIHDELTGLFNRRYLDEELARVVALHERLGFPLSVAFFDVDFFKQYNDSYGHQAGDAVLREIAMVLRKGFGRDTDVVGRYGGEEFVVLSAGEALVSTFYEHVDAVREAIAALCIPHESSACASVVTISAGVYFGEIVSEGEPASVIDAADKALYQAKARGRNRVVISDLVKRAPSLAEASAVGAQSY